MAKGECVFKALHLCLETPIDKLKEEFEYGERRFCDTHEPIPPGVHQIMDYFMEMGGALVPVARDPKSEHGGQVFYDYDPDASLERWENYLKSYNGFLIGRTSSGTAHMAWLKWGKVYDRDLIYSWTQCGVHGFYPDTFLVLLWQA